MSSEQARSRDGEPQRVPSGQSSSAGFSLDPPPLGVPCPGCMSHVAGGCHLWGPSGDWPCWGVSPLGRGHCKVSVAGWGLGRGRRQDVSPACISPNCNHFSAWSRMIKEIRSLPVSLLCISFSLSKIECRNR